jgi:deoxyribose-phosphate aldolase
MNLAAYIEHSALKPGTVISDIESVCSVAVEYKFSTICIPPLFVKTAKNLTAETGIKVSTVIGFPFGYSAIEAKVAEIVLAIIDGADEIEMVINTSAVKNKDWQFLAAEINTVMPIVRGKGKAITVILETGLMSEPEIITACDVYGAAGVDFIKAGTGFIENEPAIEHIKLIRKHLAAPVGIKSAAAIKNYGFALDIIKAGAGRLCCNNGLQLLQETLQQFR